MLHWLWVILIGLVIDAIAKLVMPGKDPGGIVVSSRELSAKERYELACRVAFCAYSSASAALRVSSNAVPGVCIA